MSRPRGNPSVDPAFTRAFSQRFSYAIGESGLPPKAVAKDAGIGYQTVLSFMRGERVPGGWTLAKVCPVLGVTSDWLLGIEVE